MKTCLLCLRRSWFTSTSVVILISAASIHGCWIPALKTDIDAMKRRVAELSQRQTGGSGARLRESRSLLKKEQQHLRQLLGALADDPAAIRREFLHWGSASVMGVRWSRPRPGVATGPWSNWRVPVELRCTYSDLRSFLSQLGTLSQIVGVTECNIETSREANNLIKATVVLEIPARTPAPMESETQ